MMAMETTLDANGVAFGAVKGTDAEIEELKQSYGHLVKLRDEVISMGIIPATADWSSVNPNL